ncbi:MAG TPA: hypothetical protein PLS00_01075 [Niabella sp.]|nr:hypothetical protein [Niabella sp.]
MGSIIAETTVMQYNQQQAQALEMIGELLRPDNPRRVFYSER